MRTTLLLLALLAGPVLAGQTVWKWVDENGVTHYADRPVPGATKMELSTGTTSNAPSFPASTPAATPSPAAETGPVYRNFEIWKPGDDETIANSGGQVNVNIRIQPSLQSGHALNLYLDGKLVTGFPDNTDSYALTNVARGMHRLVAVVTANGTRVQETPGITFHVQQQSQAQPPVGPALRPPPPKPQPRAGNKAQTSQPTYAALNPQRSAPIDPVTNRPVVTKPATSKPSTPKSPQGK